MKMNYPNQTLTYPFTQQEMWDAVERWGCNCGPSALAFALQKKPDEVLPAIPDFQKKWYTSPTMMKAALAHFGVGYTAVKPVSNASMFGPAVALVRVQWTGPWTAEGSNPRWAYGYTHWITTWQARHYLDMPPANLLFDINCGINHFHHWEACTVPELTGHHKRADGGWHPTHVWRLNAGNKLTPARAAAYADLDQSTKTGS